jgi:hypothetical protein
LLLNLNVAAAVGFQNQTIVKKMKERTKERGEGEGWIFRVSLERD